MSPAAPASCDILNSGDALRSSAIYPVMLLLVAFGAFTKSAQFPAHIWLPRAMTAPTPASAFLHSATMVKAGIYLMARMNPALGFTDLWFYLLTGVGVTTMIVGAYLGLKQNDLKSLLAYSTISQLGVMMAMIGQDISIAFKALVIAVLAHALYKSALFMVAGIVDHETGTRDLRRLGGLRKTMPVSFVIAAVAGLSMAGLPPLFGFLAKETLLATVTHPELPAVGRQSVGGALGRGRRAAAGPGGPVCLGHVSWQAKRPDHPRPRGAAWHVAGASHPRVPVAAASGLAPDPKQLAEFLASAAEAAYGEAVKVSLALWTGLNVPLVLSLIAISIGLVIFVYRDRVRAAMMRSGDRWGFQQLYLAVLRAIDWAARQATRLQSGNLRTYLSIMLVSVLLLLVAAVTATRTELWSPSYSLTWPALDFSGELEILRVFALLVITGAAVATIALSARSGSRAGGQRDRPGRCSAVRAGTGAGRRSGADRGGCAVDGDPGSGADPPAAHSAPPGAPAHLSAEPAQSGARYPDRHRLRHGRRIPDAAGAGVAAAGQRRYALLRGQRQDADRRQGYRGRDCGRLPRASTP